MSFDPPPADVVIANAIIKYINDKFLTDNEIFKNSFTLVPARDSDGILAMSLMAIDRGDVVGHLPLPLYVSTEMDKYGQLIVMFLDVLLATSANEYYRGLAEPVPEMAKFLHKG